MKLRNTFFAMVFALLLGLSAIAQQAQPVAEPKLVMESFSHDFGEIKAGTPLTYSFILKNQGKADLLIKNVAPG